ncbi:DUF5366 family protein [Alkalihalobacillus hemicellulosilyticus]|uniref:Putative membrane protein n=1 Tax=Halalkalibacter hemicellulosilyticusJCM 9152 TaxID=1236971 RepID=W4QEA8_9BACI|nr:DUF5366 family protein [Halalkalibacter hemicellulosilyticus]GAE29993.1 putative membrane protein [Halalkalibacter hemicellulosilyticusJCM 9152]
MTNRYITSHFPLISIVLFSLALAIYVQGLILTELVNMGVYSGMLEFISENGIKLTLLFLLMLFFFMVFSALKLITDTTIELSMLFFSKDEEGTELSKARGGSWIYLIGSVVSLFVANQLIFILALFLLASFIYFVFLIYKVSDVLSFGGLVGFIFFQVFFWGAFVISVVYALVRLYNSFMASLPI